MTASRFRPRKTLKALMSAAVLGAVLLGGVSLLGAQALAQGSAQGSDMQILLDRMERLERDIRTLNRQIARRPAASGAPAPVSEPMTEPVSGAKSPQIQFDQNEGALSRVTVRLDALEQEVRQATGLNENLSYSISQISARLDKLITDLDYRLARLEGGAVGGTLGGGLAGQPPVSAIPSPAGVSKVGEMAAPTAEQGTLGANGTYTPPESGGGLLGSISKNTLDQLMPDAGGAEAGEGAPDGAAQLAPPAAQATAPMAAPAAAPTAPPAATGVLPEGTPRERYQFAFGLMSQARYSEAEVALKEFIAQHADDPLAANAWYWLGETYYVRKTFMEAAQTFFQAYKTAPDGTKAPDSLLKLGMSMANLDKVEEACTTFGKLRKEYVNLKPTIERTLNRETKRLKCQ